MQSRICSRVHVDWASAGLLSAETSNVGNILWTTGSALSSEKVVAPDERNFDVVDDNDHAPGPCVFEFDTFNRYQDVDPIWRIAKLDDRIWLDETVLGQPRSRETEYL